MKSNGVDYLLKPVNKDDLKTAIEKCRRVFQNKQPNSLDIATLLSAFAPGTLQQTAPKEKFIVNFRNTLLPVKTSDIAYFVGEQLIYLCTFDNQRHILDYDTLDEIESVLNTGKFYLANRQYIVNESAIKSVHAHATGAEIIFPFDWVCFCHASISHNFLSNHEFYTCTRNVAIWQKQT